MQKGVRILWNFEIPLCSKIHRNIMNPKVSIIIPTINRRGKLKNCLESISNNDYGNYEIIVIDNGSSYDIDKLFIEINIAPNKLIKNFKNEGLAKARNQGIAIASGQYLLFIDDDNVIDNQMINHLVNKLNVNTDSGIVAPKTYYKSEPHRIWFYGAGINLMTSRKEFPYYNVIDDKNQLSNDLQVSSVHNCFMISREIIDRIGGFDEKLFVTHTEFDLCMKAKKHCTIYVCGNALCYHDRPPDVKIKSLRQFGITNGYRVYFLARNRAVVINRYSNIFQKTIFILLFYPIYTLYYSLIFLLYEKYDYLYLYLKGTVDGICYFINNDLKQITIK